jgi:hypothetical protein
MLLSKLLKRRRAEAEGKLKNGSLARGNATPPKSSNLSDSTTASLSEDAPGTTNTTSIGPLSRVPTASTHPTSSDSQAKPDGRDILPERLWDRAYDDLKADQPSLVKAYERILSRELEENASGGTSHTSIITQDWATRQIQMGQLVQAGLKKTEREARIKKGIGDTMQVVLSVRGIIDSAIQAVPQAALAWTGVCLALQVWSQRRRVAYADFPRSS